MRNLPGLLLMMLILLNCQGNQEQREALRELSTDWDQAFTLVYRLVDQVEDEQRTWQEQYETIELSREEMGSLDTATRRQLIELQNACRAYGEKFNAIAEEVEAFTLNFDNQTGALEELETQVEEGREVPDLYERIESFENILRQLAPRIAAWQQRLQNIREECRRDCWQYIRLAKS